MQVKHLAIVRSLLRCVRMFREIFENGKSWNSEYLLFPHDPHGLVAQLVGMVDRNDPSLRRIKRARFAGRMNGDVLTRARGFVDRDLKFSLCVLVNRGE